MKTTIAAILAAIALAAGACSTAEAEDGVAGKAAELDQTVLETARAACAPGSPHITVADSGATLLLDHQGEDEATGASLDDVVCVLVMLDVPTSVLAEMDSTRALDGRMSASWDGFDVSWSYHPDSGIDMIVTEG